MIKVTKFGRKSPRKTQTTFMTPCPLDAFGDSQRRSKHNMKLNTYRCFEKDIADVTVSGTMASETSKSEKNDSHKRKSSCSYAWSNNAGDISSNNKRTKASGRLSALSLPSNDVVYNTNDANNLGNIGNVRNVSNAANLTNGIINANYANNNIPFPATNWWKTGTDHIRELMTTSLGSTNDAAIDANNKCAINNINSDNATNDRTAMTASVGLTSSTQSCSVQFPSQALTAIPMGQEYASWLQVSGKATASGSNHLHNTHRHPDSVSIQTQSLTKNTGVYHSGPTFASQSVEGYSSTLPKQILAGNMPDPSIFSTETTGMTTTPSHAQQQQQHKHHYQHQHQQEHSFQRFPYHHAPSSFYTTQNAYLQQHQSLKQGLLQGCIANRGAQKSSTNNGGTQPSQVDRELEESFREDISFDEEDANCFFNPNNSSKANVEDIDILFPEIDCQPSPKAEDNPPECVSGGSLDVGKDMNVLVNGESHLKDKQTSNRSHMMSKNSDAESNPSAKEVKFRAYQAENWTKKFEELLKFREENGHCLVPNCHPPNPALAQWTKRQRYQYKLKQDGKRSTITDERVQALENAGFIWDSHKAVWSERLEELKQFRREFDHCNVPSRYQKNHQLAIWVKRQRRQWKNKMDQLPNCMTDERQEALEAIGFVWDMKKKKKQKGNKSNEQDW